MVCFGEFVELPVECQLYYQAVSDVQNAHFLTSASEALVESSNVS